jgi:hypothetical protein
MLYNAQRGTFRFFSTTTALYDRIIAPHRTAVDCIFYGI